MLFEKVQLEKNEVVLKIVRKHWFVIISELFAILIMAMLPFFLLLIFAFIPENLNLFNVQLGDYISLITFATAGWILLSVMTGFMIWTNFYLDLWIITDRRVIVVEQLHFFNRNVGVFRLERLQDIEIKVRGILQTFLNFGSLSVQTAGHFESNFSSNSMPDPRGLQSIIQKATDERMQKLHNVSAVTH